MTKTQANEPGFVPDAAALEAAAKASYEYEGDRRGIDYLGWGDEPENVRAQWQKSVRLPVETYCSLVSAPFVPSPAYGGAVRALPRVPYDEGEVSGWTLTQEVRRDLQKVAERWELVTLEAVEAIALEVERRVLSCLSRVTAEEADAKADPAHLVAIKALIDAGNRLSLCAQTSGGTAGRDEGLVEAINCWSDALAQARSMKRIAFFEPASTPSPQIGNAGVVPEDVAALVIAARNILPYDPGTNEDFKALDEASEAFASRVPFDEAD